MKQLFEIGHDPRRNLRNWLENNFDYFKGDGSAEKLEDVIENSVVIFSAVSEVMNFTKKYSGESIVDYYKNDLPNITTAFNDKKYEEFAKYVQNLKCAIDVE